MENNIPDSITSHDYLRTNYDDALLQGAVDAKGLFRNNVGMVSTDRIQANIGRVMQFECKSYQRLFSSYVDDVQVWSSWASLQHVQGLYGEWVPFTVDEVALILTSCDSDFLNELKLTLESNVNRQQLAGVLDCVVAISFSAMDQKRGKLLEWKGGIYSKKVAESFLDRARELEAKNKINQALDLVYASIDKMLRFGKFEDVNQLLSSLNISEHSIDVLLTLLLATFPAKSKLANRPVFFGAITKMLDEKGENTQALLVGLQ